MKTKFLSEIFRFVKTQTKLEVWDSKKIHKLFYLLIMLYLSSCSETKEDKYRRLLTNNSEKYWLVIDKYPTKKYRGICFKKDGTYIGFYIKDGKRYFDKQFGKPIWSISNDSFIRSKSYIDIIEYLNEDIIALNATEYKSTYFYIKSPDQTTKIELPTPSRIDTFYM